MELIDVHTHLAPATQGAETYAEIEKLFQPGSLVEHLDQTGFDGALVSVPPPFYRQGQSLEATTAWVDQLNLGILKAVVGKSQLKPLAYLPLDQPELALAIAQKSSGKFSGFTASVSANSVAMHDDRMLPLWRKLDDLGAPLFLHPGNSSDHRLKGFYLENLLGNPLETTIAVAQLSFGGILERYPKMRIVLAHCGGMVSSVVGRWDQGARTSRPDVNTELELPSRSIQRLWVDSVVHDDSTLQHAVHQFGRDKIVPGSDWPFLMGSARPLDELQRAGIDREQIQANLLGLLT